MSNHGRFYEDEVIRRSWFNPEELLQSIGVQTGMTFMDIGCGDGFFTIIVAKMVGEKGTVYAVDTNADAIETLKKKAQTQGIANIIAIVANAESAVLCRKCADIIFFSMVLHDFENSSKVLKNAIQMIKPEGLLVDLDWKKLEMPFGPPYKIRLSEHEALTLIHDAGFKGKTSRHVGLYHYLLTATPRKTKE